MGMKQRALAGLAAVGILLAAPLPAQQMDPAPRPGFLGAMGLLEQTPFPVTTESMGKPVARNFSIDLPSSSQVDYRTRTDAEGTLLAVEFVTSAGGFVESIIFTEAKLAQGELQDRMFATANILVLSAFPALQQSYPDARILGFGATSVAGMPAVQLIGTHRGSPLGPVLFRLVGYLPPGSADTVVALASLSAVRMPAQGDAQLVDSYSGMTLESLKFAP